METRRFTVHEVRNVSVASPRWVATIARAAMVGCVAVFCGCVQQERANGPLGPAADTLLLKMVGKCADEAHFPSGGRPPHRVCRFMVDDTATLIVMDAGHDVQFVGQSWSDANVESSYSIIARRLDMQFGPGEAVCAENHRLGREWKANGFYVDLIASRDSSRIALARSLGQASLIDRCVGMGDLPPA